MTKNSIQEYTRKIADANPTELIVLVYEIAENYLDEAIMAHKEADAQSFKANIDKASKCGNDLIEALDVQYDISKQLMDIYLFINRELALSVVKNDSSMVVRIQAMMTKLKNTFVELSKKDDSSKVMGNTQEVYAGLTYGKSALTENTMEQNSRGYKV